MVLLLVLNERSYSDLDSTRDQISLAVRILIKTIKCIRQYRNDSVLVTERGLFDIELASGYSLRVWAGDGRNRDAARYLKNLQQRSPFQGIAPAHLDGIVEYHLDGEPAAGLGLAHLVGGFGVSLRLHERWDREVVELELTELDDDGEKLITSTIQVRHACHDQHVMTHERWLCDEGLAQVRSGVDLWSANGDLFPNLAFLPRVEEDLVGLRDYWLEPVKERLAELQTATARWDVTELVEPQWLSKITPESASRKKLCHFVDLDGQVELFALHARFTPGAGRLHFRVDRTKQRLVIAYIGPKLERPRT